MKTNNLKFKAWNIRTKEMFDVKKILWEKDGVYAYYGLIKLCGEPEEVKLLQFSGLYDIYEREIWEGDLLLEDHTDVEGNKDWVIIEIIFNSFGDVGYKIRKSYLEKTHNVLYDIRLNRSDTRLKKIGNKYTNPQILRRFKRKGEKVKETKKGKKLRNPDSAYKRSKKTLKKLRSRYK